MFGILSLLTSCWKDTDKNNFLDDSFKVGQIWKYKTRIGEENSTLTILKVEKYYDKEIIVHIFVDGLKLKNTMRPTGISEDIGHLPVSKESLTESVTKLVSENNKLPDFREGYNSWKEAFESKKGGSFSVSVSEIVEFVEETMKTASKE